MSKSRKIVREAENLLRDNKDIQTLLHIFTDNQMGEKARNLQGIVSDMDNMEKQFSTILNELQAVKESLESLQSHQKLPFREKMLGIVNKMEGQVKAARDQLHKTKTKLIEGAKRSIEAFKAKGREGLKNTLDFLGIKGDLVALHGAVSGLAQSAAKNEERVTQIGQELRSAGGHLKNTGRLLLGKEAKETKSNEVGLLTKTVAKPFQLSRNTFGLMEKQLAGTVKRIEGLEDKVKQDQQKKPLKQRLQENKNKIAATEKKTPEKSREAAL